MTVENPTMPLLSRRSIAIIGTLALVPAVIRAQTPADVTALATALRAGGLAILIRHGATFADQADTDPFNLDNVAAQRNLNESGKALARAFGDALRQAGVPIGKVYTSRFNRAYETATLAGFTDIEKTADLTEGGLIVTPNENNRRAEALRRLLATPPKPGTNTVLVTHKPNIVDALGKDWFDVQEGEASIFRSDAGKFVLVARVQMADWPRIAMAAKR
jgi:broad specificity phosphatase PhoE